MDMANPQRGFRTLLKNRDFLLLWLAQLLSMTILNASNYALLVLIEEITGSTTLIGVAIIDLSLLPAFKLLAITIEPVEMLYAIIGVLYLVCAGLIWLIPAQRFSQQRKITEHLPLGMMSKMWKEMRQGWSFVRRSPQLFLAVVQ